MAELASLFFFRPGFPLEGFATDFFFALEEDEEEEEEDFILASSASKAGARVLTMVSRSDCVDRERTARETEKEKVSEKLYFGGFVPSLYHRRKTKTKENHLCISHTIIQRNKTGSLILITGQSAYSTQRIPMRAWGEVVNSI